MDINNFLQIAKSDLKSSIDLYEGNNYSQSLFCFHQSVEKATKYMGLATGGITEDQLKKSIKHNNVKLFELLLQDLNSKSIIKIDINPDDFIKLSQSLNHRTDTERVWLIWQQIETIIFAPPQIQIDNSLSPLSSILKYIKSFVNLDHIIGDNQNELFYKYAEQRLESVANDYIIFVNYGHKVLPLLFAFSLFTNSYYVDDFRYPTQKIDNPLEFFSKEHPYVVELPILSNLFDRTLEMLGQIKWNILQD